MSRLNEIIAQTDKSGEIQHHNHLVLLNNLKEDALKFAQNLQSGWIKRQESMNLISPKRANLQRFELEKWVSSHENSSKETKTVKNEEE